VTLYDKAITLCGLSKSWCLPGLRIGWVASQDAALLERVAALKDYTTICSSAPSEVGLSSCARMRAHARAGVLMPAPVRTPKRACSCMVVRMLEHLDDLHHGWTQ
jgi:DNA-binding transcriptional MocR family regulator